MNIEQLEIAQRVVMPLIGSAGTLLGRLLDGSMSMAVARADLRNILATAVDRLNAADDVFAKRDAAESARVAALPENSSDK